MEQPGYEEDRCHFCGGDEAGFQMREAGTNDTAHAKYFDACQKCVRSRVEEGQK